MVRTICACQLFTAHVKAITGDELLSAVHSGRDVEMQQSAQEHRFYKFAWLTPQSLSSPLTHLVMCIFLEYAREESSLLHLLLFKMSRVTTPS